MGAETKEIQMIKPLAEMTDAELFIHGTSVLVKMCDSMTNSHKRFAEIFADEHSGKLANVMLRDSLRRCLEGVGCILNGIDLIDEDVAESSAPLFNELHRRFKK
jgi:hypothetical protein